MLIIAQPSFEQINTQIHNWCIANILNYNAVKWAGELIHPTDGRTSLVVDDRVINSLSETNKTQLVNITEDWIKKNII